MKCTLFKAADPEVLNVVNVAIIVQRLSAAAVQGGTETTDSNKGQQVT